MVQKSSSRQGPKRPPMTPQEAVTFERMSEASAQQIQELIETRAQSGTHVQCFCRPYDDVFTYRRWQAQSMQVKKGERALPLASYVAPDSPNERVDNPSEETIKKRKLFPRTLFVFCRCQVERAAEPAK